MKYLTVITVSATKCYSHGNDLNKRLQDPLYLSLESGIELQGALDFRKNVKKL